MTSEERNRRMKYGHDVPRWWIPDFNVTHKHANQNSVREARRTDHSDQKILREHYETKRRLRRMAQRQQVVRLHKDLRLVQKAAALLALILGLISGGPVGFVIGACIGLALLALRLPSP